MCLAWAWCDICLIGLVNIYTHWHEIDVYENSKSGWINMGKVRVGRNPMTFVGSVHGGASSNGHNSTRVRGGASRPGHNSTRVRGGASRLGHNSTKASWWWLM